MALSLNTIGIPSLFVLSLQSEYYHLSQYPATDSHESGFRSITHRIHCRQAPKHNIFDFFGVVLP
jgi:hypothetical protein